jgi:hypothetical protein
MAVRTLESGKMVFILGKRITNKKQGKTLSLNSLFNVMQCLNMNNTATLVGKTARTLVNKGVKNDRRANHRCSVFCAVVTSAR